jgi:hypothetical protein
MVKVCTINHFYCATGVAIRHGSIGEDKTIPEITLNVSYG